jgi:nucleoside-diphosphate-sugar epimerase
VRVLLTGGNGFLGSHVAERLGDAGVDLRLMLRRTSDMRFFSEMSWPYERVEGDLRDVESLRKAVEGVEVVAHVGGLTSSRDESLYQAVNATGTANLVEAARHRRHRRHGPR